MLRTLGKLAAWRNEVDSYDHALEAILVGMAGYPAERRVLH